MTGEVIKSFLVGLGFGVDDASLSKFNKAITSATVKVAAMYATISAAAVGIFAGITKMSEGFEEMGYQLRIVAPAINKMLILRQAMLSAYQAAGINLTKVVQQSILFNYSLAKTKFALEAVYKSVGAKFLPILTKQLDIFRLKIFANMPKIQESLTKMVTWVFKAFDSIVQLGTTLWSVLGRVWDFFKLLDEATGGWSTKILLAVAAWKYLNLSFLATPLGAILAGLVAILALYDDFKVYTEGGKSFFNWGPALPIIHAVGGALSVLADIVKNLFLAFKALFSNDLPGFFGGVGKAVLDLKGLFMGLWDVVKGLGSGLWNIAKAVGAGVDAIGSKVAGMLGATQISPTLNGVLQPSPLMQSAGSNTQKVNQETHINIQGSADSNAVGKAVANEQTKVNFDMTRNLKGAMR